MKPVLLSYILRGTKAVMWLLLISTGMMTLELAGKVYDAATAPETEVRLRLDTFRPNLFGFWHDTQAGYEDGKQGRPRREQRGPLRAMPATTSFELAADPHAPLLRYREPSGGKRAG